MKPRKVISITLGLFLLSFLLISWLKFTPKVFAAAGIRRTVNFQGKLVNKSDGTNIADGSYSFTFKFYDAPSGGTQLPSGAAWTETQTITVTNGIFRAELGASTAIPTTLDFNSDSIYLDFAFNGETFTTRVRMTAVPYAFNAEKVGGLTVTNTTGTLTVPNGKTISFGDNFTTSGANPLTLTTSGTTNATLPSGTVTLVDTTSTQTLTNKSIGSTGLTFLGATTDITTGTNEDLVILPNGSGKVGIGGTAPSALLSVGTTSQFQVNSSGAIAAATGITSSGTISFTGVAGGSGSGICLNGSNQLVTCTAGNGAVSGSGINGQITFWNGTSTVSGNNNFWWDSTNGRLGIGTSAPAQYLELANASANVTFSSSTGPHQIFTGGLSNLALMPGGNVGIGGTSPTSLLSVGTTSQFQVNSSGAIAASTGINNSGAYTQSGSSSNTLSGLSLFTAVGLGIQVTNNAGVLGSLGIGTTNPAESVDIAGSLANLTFSGTTGPHKIVTGGSTNLALMPGGNVGIGTTAPSVKLDVVGQVKVQTLSGTATNALCYDGSNILTPCAASSSLTGTGISNYTARWTSNSALGTGTLYDNGASVGIGTSAPVSLFDVNGKLNVLSGGNVGIGTTAPGYKLDVNGTGNISGAVTLGSTLNVTGAITAPTSSNTINNLVINSGALSSVTGITTSGSYTQSGSSPNTFSGYNTFTAPGLALSVTNNAAVLGNLGVGTTNPATTLQVNNATNLTNNGTASQYALNITQGSNTLGLGAASNYAALQSFNSQPLALNPAGNNVGIGTTNPGVAKLAVFGGNVGIGTTTPGQALDVVGNVAIESAATDANSTTAALDINGPYIRIGDAINPQTFANGLGIKFNDAGVAHASIKYLSSAGKIFFCDSSNTSSLACNAGAETVTMDLTNKYLGVGTTAPSALLSVGASSQFQVNSSGAITAPTSTNTINSLIINGSTQTLSANNIADSGALTIKSATGSGNALTLDSGDTGNVNLGTSLNAKNIGIGNSTGGTAVLIKAGTGSIVLAGAATGTSATYLGLPVKTDSGDPTTTQVNGAIYYNSNSNLFRCYQANAWTNCIGSGAGLSGGVPGQVTYWNGTTTVAGSNNFWWNNTNSRLGIGNSAPIVTLDVIGNTYLRGTGSVGLWVNSGVGVGTTNPSQSLDIGTSQGNLTFSSSTGPHQILTGGATNLALMPGGNVGIGTTNPGSPFTIVTSTQQAQLITDTHANGLDFKLSATGTGGRDFTFSSTANSSTYSGGRFVISDSTAGQARFMIDQNGNVGIGSSGNNITSGTFAGATMVLKNGNVGIGTTNPGASLDLASAGTIQGAGLSGDCSSTSSKLLWSSTTKQFLCGTDRASKTIVKSSGQSMSNSTTLVDDNTLSFTPGSSETWIVDMQFHYSQANTTGGYKFSLAAPASSTCSWEGVVYYLGANTYGTSTCGDTLWHATDSSYAAVNEPVRITGQVVTPVSSSGNIRLQFAQNTANAGAITINSGEMLAYKVSGADLAEIYYGTERDIQQGMVVQMDPDNVAGVKKATAPYGSNILGVVSTKPGTVLADDIIPVGAVLPIALAGRVPVKVSAINGNINVGDLLTASSIPGVAMKATRPGYIIGRALTSFAGQGTGVLMAFVNTQYADPGMIMNLKDGIQVDANTPKVDNIVISYNTTGDLVLKNTDGNFNMPGLTADKKNEIKITDVLIKLDELSRKQAEQATSSGVLTSYDRELLNKLQIDENGNLTFLTKSGKQQVLTDGLITFDATSSANISTTNTSSASASMSLGQLKDYFANAGYKLGEEHGRVLLLQQIESAFGEGKISTQSGDIASDSAHTASGSANLISQTFDTTKDYILKGAIELWNKVTFKGVAEYLAEVFFKSNVHFDGQVEFNSDTGGYVLIKKGERFVDVKFDKSYKNEPVVNLSSTIPTFTQQRFQDFILSGDCDAAAGLDVCREKISNQILSTDVKAALTGKSEQGFIVMLNKPAQVDMTFSWQAIAVKDVKTVVSKSAEVLLRDTGSVAGVSTSSSAQLAPAPSITPIKLSDIASLSAVLTPAEPPKKVRVIRSSLGFVRLREGSSTTTAEIDQIPSDTELIYTEIKDSWYKVIYKGQSGWVSGEFVK